tara:strand:- start:64 stop:936 length:873 start_codon:yes stop_codon:yes gene_type:complete
MIQHIGIIGAGQMGSGIAHVGALNGFEIILVDIDEGALAGALESVKKNMSRQVRKELIGQQSCDDALARIKTGAAVEDLKACDLVIEAAAEDENIKKQIFASLKGVIKPEAIICTNTSSISVTRLAASTDRPGQFMGMHFMNPVPMMELVELVRGIATEEETYDQVRDVAVKMGKKTAMAEDFPAFIVNRILLPMINEAIYALYEGVGTVESIDTAMRLGAHHPMGPLQLADFIGLDTCHAIMQVLYEGLADSKYRPCPLLAKYVEAGWLGRKSGRGFYDYAGETPVPTR